jgi:L-ascorbate metabolism protein UlaG (beta-lactamase superfamily)
MKQIIHVLIILNLFVMNTSCAQKGFEKDTFKTNSGDLVITFIGHATLMMEWNGKVIHIDPWSNLARYSELPDADIILITHHHFDHLDKGAVSELKKSGTVIILTENCYKELKEGVMMKYGDIKEFSGIKIEAIPAYNILHMRSENNPYHPKGEGNGYVLTFSNLKVYVAGDTENIPEMKNLKNIDVAFLPMNLPYTMTPEMVADAALTFKPKVLYPYHLSNTNTDLLLPLLKESGIDVRIRKMQ